MNDSPCSGRPSDFDKYRLKLSSMTIEQHLLHMDLKFNNWAFQLINNVDCFHLRLLMVEKNGLTPTER